jgi:hypothetical protein
LHGEAVLFRKRADRLFQEQHEGQHRQVERGTAHESRAIPACDAVDIPGNKPAEREGLDCRLPPRYLEAIVKRSGLLVDGFGRPDTSTTSSVEPIVKILAREELASELFGRPHGVAGIMSDFAATIANATNHAHKLGVRITGKLLKLMDNAERRPWIRLFGSKHHQTLIASTLHKFVTGKLKEPV